MLAIRVGLGMARCLYVSLLLCTPTARSVVLRDVGRLRGGQASPTLARREPLCCSETGDRKVACRVLEHALPKAEQTHEVIYDPHTHSVLISQMEEGRLLRVPVDETGELGNPVEGIVIGEAEGREPDSAKPPLIGLHGLALSELFPRHVWVTLQYQNKICLVDIGSLEVVSSFACPRTLADGETAIGGPHSLVEKRGHLFVTMKGGASCHGPPDEASLEEATAHGVWRVPLATSLGGGVAGPGEVFQVPATPPMCAVDDDGTCWVVCDSTPCVAKIPWEARASADDTTGSLHACASADSRPEESSRVLMLPFQYAGMHGCGPGIVIGPDGRPWFCALGGAGLIGTVTPCGHVKMFELHTHAWNAAPRICHLRWCFEQRTLFCISSDLVDETATNTLIRAKFDETYSQIVAQHELAMPTQAAGCHRIAMVPRRDGECSDSHGASVLVSELTRSQLLQVMRATLPDVDNFPMKTMTFTTNRVYDALAPCPRAGTPICNCDVSELSGAIGAEDPFDTPGVSAEQLAIANEGGRFNHTDPRTGELKFVSRLSDLPAFVFSGMPTRGFPREDVPMIPGASSAPRAAAPTGADTGPGAGNLGVNLQVAPEARTYRKGYLQATLRREPWRMTMLLPEIKAAGLTVDELTEEGWDWGLPGSYDDSNHRGCARRIDVVGEAARISGADEDGTPWSLTGHLNTRSGVLTVDFGPKGGPKVQGQVVTALPLSMTKAPGVVWSDGGVWEKVS